jgi:hypothetical protein
MANAINASAVLTGSCVVGSVGGCVAQNSYVTGDGAGGTINTIDFNGRTAIDPNGIATFSGNFGFDIGGRLSNDSSDYLVLTAGGYLVINFTQPIVYFGLYWGTPDAGLTPQAGTQGINVVTFNNVNGNVTNQLAQFNPTQIPGLNPVNFSFSSDDSYVSFNADGLTFNQVILSDLNQGNFEVDNFSYVAGAATPIPAALPLFATGLSGLGLLGWRRKRKAQVAT